MRRKRAAPALPSKPAPEAARKPPRRPRRVCAPWPRVWCGGPAEPLGPPELVTEFAVDTRNDGNAGGGRGKVGWAKVHRTEAQRAAVEMALTFPDQRVVHLALSAPFCVRLTRLSSAAEPLDDDAPPGALKAVRDAVAAALEVDDGDPAVAFAYAQERRPGPMGVRIEVWDADSFPGVK
jgi:hypothetical protein